VANGAEFNCPNKFRPDHVLRYGLWSVSRFPIPDFTPILLFFRQVVNLTMVRPHINFHVSCSSGEATVAFVEWCTIGKRLFHEHETSLQSSQPAIPGPTQLPRRKGTVTPWPLGPEFPKPHISAADPVGLFLVLEYTLIITCSIPLSQFTVEAYKERTSYPCEKLSFEDVAEGNLPTTSINIASGSLQEITVPELNETENQYLIDTVVCSFALHLVEGPSGLFSLLWQLSLRARWLVILAPHKRPEVPPFLFFIFIGEFTDPHIDQGRMGLV